MATIAYKLIKPILYSLGQKHSLAIYSYVFKLYIYKCSGSLYAWSVKINVKSTLRIFVKVTLLKPPLIQK